MISNAIWNKFGTILLVFKKIYLCLFIPNCTWNHVITYTKQMILAKIALVSAQLPSYI